MVWIVEAIKLYRVGPLVNVAQLDQTIPCKGNYRDSLISLAGCQAIAPVNIGDRLFFAEARFLDIEYFFDFRSHLTHDYFIEGAECDQRSGITELVRVEFISI